MPQRRRLDLDGESVPLNAVEVTEYEDEYDDDVQDEFVPERDVQHIWIMSHNMRNKKAPLLKDDVACWHCGQRGHYAGECEINLQGLPQTPRGAQVFASFNRMRGEVRVYDAKQQLDNSEKFRQRREKYNKNNRASPASSSSSSDAPAKKNRRRLNKVQFEDNDGINEDTSSTSSSSSRRDVVNVQSHVIELSPDDRTDDEDDTKKHVVQLSSIDSIMYPQSSLRQVQQQEKKDAVTATSLCLPIEVNGVSVGYALGDQGATKTIMRASALAKSGVKVKEHAVKNHYVVCADGGEIPIRSRFQASVTSNGKSLGDTLIYVVDDTGTKDITCDMVVGRSTMAASRFNCIDTKRGTLFDKSTGEEIKCLPGKFIDSQVEATHCAPLCATVITTITGMTARPSLCK